MNKEIFVDEYNHVKYTKHDGKRYDYYCPTCHIDHSPESKDGVWVVEIQANGAKIPICEPFDETIGEWVEYGLCARCNKDSPYMLVLDAEKVND